MCPRLGGSAFFESGEIDLGVSSKAHKFACELRALLASDKHLGSAERSERQVLKKQTRQRVPEALWRISVRFAEAAALPCIHRMCRRVWDSKSGKVRLGVQVRHREGALGRPLGGARVPK